VTVCHWASSTCCFEDCGASETSGGTHTRTQHHVREDLNLQHHYY